MFRELLGHNDFTFLLLIVWRPFGSKSRNIFWKFPYSLICLGAVLILGNTVVKVELDEKSVPDVKPSLVARDPSTVAHD